MIVFNAKSTKRFLKHECHFDSVLVYDFSKNTDIRAEGNAFGSPQKNMSFLCV